MEKGGGLTGGVKLIKRLKMVQFFLYKALYFYILVMKMAVAVKPSGDALEHVDKDERLLELKVNLQMVLDDPYLPSLHRRFLKRCLRIVEEMA